MSRDSFLSLDQLANKRPSLWIYIGPFLLFSSSLTAVFYSPMFFSLASINMGSFVLLFFSPKKGGIITAFTFLLYLIFFFPFFQLWSVGIVLSSAMSLLLTAFFFSHFVLLSSQGEANCFALEKEKREKESQYDQLHQQLINREKDLSKEIIDLQQQVEKLASEKELFEDLVKNIENRLEKSEEEKEISVKELESLQIKTKILEKKAGEKEEKQLEYFYLYKQLRDQFKEKDEQLHLSRKELFYELEKREILEKRFEEKKLEESTEKIFLIEEMNILKEELETKEEEIQLLEKVINTKVKEKIVPLVKKKSKRKKTSYVEIDLPF